MDGFGETKWQSFQGSNILITVGGYLICYLVDVYTLHTSDTKNFERKHGLIYSNLIIFV